MKVSKSTIRALRIVEKHGKIRPRGFAQEMWADSPCWSKVYNVGNGATRGAGMWRAGGGYLGRLRSQGLLTIAFDDVCSYTLTQKGKEALK